MEILFELAGNLSDPSSSYQGSTVSQMLQTTENKLWTTGRLTSFQKAQCNPFQSHSSLGSSHWSIQGSFCICCDMYTFIWHNFWAWDYFHVSHPVWWQFWLNTFVTHPVSSFNQCKLIPTSGGSRGGHPPPAPQLFLDQTLAQRVHSPPPPPLSQGVDLALLTGTMW